MGLVVKGIEQINEGTYVAICTGVIDLGSQYNEFYKKSREEALIIWTLPYELIETESGEALPRQVSNSYSATLSGASRLRGVLEGWRGKAFTSDELKSFDLRNILGAPCLVTVKRVVGKTGREYTSVDNVAPLPKGTQLPALADEPILYDLSADWAFEEMQKLPVWIQNRIKTSEQYKAFASGGETPEYSTCDAPMPWGE